jgi:hypothetical protein
MVRCFELFRITELLRILNRSTIHLEWVLRNHLEFGLEFRIDAVDQVIHQTNTVDLNTSIHLSIDGLDRIGYEVTQ